MKLRGAGELFTLHGDQSSSFLLDHPDIFINVHSNVVDLIGNMSSSHASCFPPVSGLYAELSEPSLALAIFYIYI